MAQKLVGSIALTEKVKSRTYKAVSYPISDGWWSITCEPHVMMKLKRLFGRANLNTFETIHLKDTEEVCKDLVWFLQRYPMDVPLYAYLVERANAYDQRIEDFSNILLGLVSTQEFELAIPARDYQKVATDLWLRSQGLLVADDLGLGKTLIGIAGLTKPELRPALVVTMTHLTNQWEREIHKFAPSLTTHIIKKGSPYDICATKERGKKIADTIDETRPFPDVIIMNYHKLAGWTEIISKKIKSTIFDECQELRIDSSQKYQAALNVAKTALFRLGLSASPVFNYGGEMFNIFSVLRPEALGARDEFMREWCTGASYGGGKALKIKEPKTFGSYLREQGLMLRRTKKDVGMELPSIIKVPHYVDADLDVLDEVGDSVAELANIILSSTSNVLDRGRATRELDWRLRQATGISKAPYVAEFVKMLLESGVPKILLFGWHRTCYDLWAERLKAYKPVFYTGTESLAQKEQSFNSFCSADRHSSRIFVMSLRSGAGLDGLQQYCHTAVHGELDWSPAVHDQGDGRINRPGQEEQVVSYYLISDHGSDPVVADILGVKRGQMQGIQDPNMDIIEKLNTDEDRIKKLAESYLASRTGK